VSAAILRQIDEILSRLEEAERIYPDDESDFFSDKKFSHLWVQTKELDDLIAVIRLSLSEKYGPKSPQEDLLTKAGDHGWNAKESIFRYYINWLRRVRNIVTMALADAPAPPNTVTVNVGRDMVGSAVAGANAAVDYGQEVAIDSAAVRALIALIDDLTNGKTVPAPVRNEIDAIKADLHEIAGKKAAPVTRLQQLGERIKSIGADVISKTTAVLLADQIKSLIG